MAAVPPGRIAGSLFALLAFVLPAAAGGWDARSGQPLASSGYWGSAETIDAGAALLVEGRRTEDEAWEADAGSCVFRTVFDPVDGVELMGTGAWLEVETSVDQATRQGSGRSAWGASLSDWFHEASFWLVRSGRCEGVVLESGGRRTPLLPIEVSRTRHYRLVADETGAHLSIDGLPVLSLPLAPLRQQAPPTIRIGAGPGSVSAALVSVDHGCSRPVEVRFSRSPLGGLAVAVLGHEGFRPALEIEPGSLLVEGRPILPDSAREGDLDGDGQLDLLLDLPAGPAPTPGELLHVDARTSEGLRLRGWSSPSAH